VVVVERGVQVFHLPSAQAAEGVPRALELLMAILRYLEHQEERCVQERELALRRLLLEHVKV
jgi:hypothetical protein